MGAQSKRFGFRRAEFALSTPCIARPPLAEETKKVLAIVDKSNDPEKIAVAERVLESYQNYMRQIGLFKSEEISNCQRRQAARSLEAGPIACEGNTGQPRPKCRTCVNRLNTPTRTPPHDPADRDGGAAHRDTAAATEFENALRCNAMGPAARVSELALAEAKAWEACLHKRR